GMVEALLLEQRDGLDSQLRDSFVRAGLVHLLAISGLHVGLVTGVLLLLGRVLRLGSRRSSIVAVGTTIAYVLFLGAPHAAARAGIQVAVLLAGRMLQRPANPYALLCIAALVILGSDPQAVIEPGFQLSFAGTAGLIALRRRLLDRAPPVGGTALREALATNLAASATTTPLAAFHFGQLAPIGLVANLVAVPLLGITVPALALALLVSVVSMPAAAFLAGAGSLLLALLERMAELTASVPGGHGYASRHAVLGWTGACLVAVLVAHRYAGIVRPAVRRTAAIGAAAALLIVWPAAARHLGYGGVEIHAIDVGQGDAFAIRSPAGRWILVDAGPRSATFDAGRARVVPYLLRHGADRLEFVILTHPDGDHIGGVSAVTESLSIGAIVDPAVAAGKPLYLSAIDDAEHSRIRWLRAEAGRELRLDGMLLEFLFPDTGAVGTGDGTNDQSVVFRLAFGEFSALFTGDAPAAVEMYLARRHGAALRSQVLKVGHHGSRTSTAAEILSATSPGIALVSVGRANRYGHPAPEVLERLAEAGVATYRTDVDGAIRVRGGADGRVEVRTER
ncbi:MAG TPA: DNA internalization-related competence protein ComEC/Rec2, partial [Longimicrobiales bacterium]|nr:DNA internalization-related competence protein ComEC/Rec2 [Longimicrobiales bacterium]